MLYYTAYNKGVGSQDSVVDVPRTRRNKVPLSASRRCQQALAVAWRVEIGFAHLGSQFVLPGCLAVELSVTPVLVLEKLLPSAPNNVVPAWRRALIEE